MQMKLNLNGFSSTWPRAATSILNTVLWPRAANLPRYEFERTATMCFQVFSSAREVIGFEMEDRKLAWKKFAEECKEKRLKRSNKKDEPKKKEMPSCSSILSNKEMIVQPVASETRGKA